MKGMYVVLAVIALTLPQVRADTVIATFEAVGGGGIIVTPSLNGASVGTGIAGQYLWKEASGPPLGNQGNFSTFCIELTQDIALNAAPYQFSVVDLASAPRPGLGLPSAGMGSAAADQIRELWGQDYSKVVDAKTAATFQFAVWRIVYGAGLNVDGPNQGLLATADGWVSGLSTTGAKANVIALSSPTAQDQITIATPLPSCAWCGLALLSLLGVRKLWGGKPHGA